MIRAQTAHRHPSEHVRKRSALMTVERLSPTEFRVTPGEKGKVKRIVRFHPDYFPPRRYRSVGDPKPTEPPRVKDIYIECFAEKTREMCEANVHLLMCSHAFAVIQSLLEIVNEEGA